MLKDLSNLEKELAQLIADKKQQLSLDCVLPDGRIQRANALHRKVIKSFRKNTQKEYKNLIFLLVED